MKRTVNMTTSYEDLDRFETEADLDALLEGFDGVEVMYYGEDKRGLLTADRVVGYHMGYYPYWYDFWKGDLDAVLKEFDSKENYVRYFGGEDKSAIVQRFKTDLERAHAYDAEYAVFHVSDATIEESFTFRFRHSAEEIIEGAAEVLNEVFAEEDGSIALLMENLWLPGLTMTDPALTQLLLNKVEYPNKGIMLDTGHLLHTNFDLRTQEEGVAYINAMLDRHGDLCRHIRGMHLNQSLSGEYCQQTMADPPKMGATFEDRYIQMFTHAFKVDYHRPFTCAGVDKLIERIRPEYLTFEFLSENNEEHRGYLDAQKAALKDLKL